MGAAFDQRAFIEDKDAVGVDDGGEAVCDDEAGAVFGDLVERVLDLFFGVAVERAGGFVEDENGRVLENGTGDRHSLLLAAGKFQPALADHGGVAVGQGGDETVDLGEFRGGLDFRVGGVRAAIANVVEDGVVEQHGILRHDAERLAQR